MESQESDAASLRAEAIRKIAAAKRGLSLVPRESASADRGAEEAPFAVLTGDSPTAPLVGYWKLFCVETPFVDAARTSLELDARYVRWRRRVRVEETPVGPVFMAYNTNGGFSYYCDDSAISDAALCGAAAKYVRHFPEAPAHVPGIDPVFFFYEGPLSAHFAAKADPAGQYLRTKRTTQNFKSTIRTVYALSTANGLAITGMGHHH